MRAEPWPRSTGSGCSRPLALRDFGGRRPEGARRGGQEISTPPHIGRPHRVARARADISSIAPTVPLFALLDRTSASPRVAPPFLQSLSASPQQMISETASAAAAMKKPFSASLACWARAPPPRLLTPAWLRLRCESGLGR